MSSYVIHPIVCGLNATDQGIMTYQRHYGERIHIPIYVWVLLGPERPILIDTGLEDFMVDEAAAAELGLTVETFEGGLERLGLCPADVGVVIHTHLHNDHCENDQLCTQARFYAQASELDFMRNPHPLDHRYDADYLEGLPVEPLDGEAEVAPGIRVVLTPGHTPGGQSVIVQTAGHGRVLITGFCCNEKNFPSAGPAVCPGVHSDAFVAWDSINRVKGMLADGEIDLIVPCHALWPGREGKID